MGRWHISCALSCLAGEGTILTCIQTLAEQFSSPVGLQAQGAPFNKRLHSFLHSPTQEERFSAKRMRRGAAVQTSADGSSSRRGPVVHLQLAQRFGSIANRPACQRRNSQTRAEKRSSSSPPRPEDRVTISYRILLRNACVLGFWG